MFFASLVFNTIVAGVVFTVFGGVKLLRGERPAAAPAAPRRGARRPPAHRVPRVMGGSQEADAMPSRMEAPLPRLTPHQVLTLVGLVVLVAVTLIFDVDVGLVAISVAVVLTLTAPSLQKQAVDEVKWPVVLLICGVPYVGVLEEMGTIDWVGGNVADIGIPLLAALLLCYVGAIVSAFASSVGVLGAFIPLAVPFLMQGEVGAVGTVAALAVASTVVDVSPYSTNGALVLANAREADTDVLYRQLLIYGGIVVAVAPVLVWLALVVI